MKFLLCLALLLSMNSCNTCIGFGRDIKHGFEWCQGKTQGSGSSGGGSGDLAPIY